MHVVLTEYDATEITTVCQNNDQFFAVYAVVLGTSKVSSLLKHIIFCTGKSFLSICNCDHRVVKMTFIFCSVRTLQVHFIITDIIVACHHPLPCCIYTCSYSFLVSALL